MSSPLNRNQNSMIPNMRKRPSSLRRLLASLVLAVFALGWMGPQPAWARPAAAWDSSSIVVFGGDEILLCKGEEKTIDVTVRVTTRRLLGSIFGAWVDPPYSKIQTKMTGNVAAITLNPWQGQTSAPPVGQIHSSLAFTIVAKDVGSVTITFSDEGYDWSKLGRGQPAPKRPLADDREVTVTVKKCKFKVAYFNTWLVQEGFINPRMTASFVTEVLPNDDGDFQGLATVEGEVHPTSQPGGGLCNYKTTYLGSLAHLKGSADFKNDKMHLEMDFDSSRAKYDYKCKSYYVPVEVHKNFRGSFGPIIADGSTHDWSYVQVQYLHAAANVDAPAAIVVVREYID